MKTKDITEALRDKVSWKAFTYIITLLFLVLGWLIATSSRIEQKVDEVKNTYTEIKIDIGSIKKDISILKKDETQAFITTYRE